MIFYSIKPLVSVHSLYVRAVAIQEIHIEMIYYTMNNAQFTNTIHHTVANF